MNDAVARVQHFFAEHALAVEIVTFARRVHTAQQAAAALGVPVRYIVKSLVFEADGQPVLVLCGGDRRVDTARLAALCAARQVCKANADLTKRVTGYSIGGVPPVAHATALPIFLDEALLACDRVYAAAGTAQTLFAIAPQVLKEISGAQVAAISEAA
jgi:Cys-tRNA(Pro) deacylase